MPTVATFLREVHSARVSNLLDGRTGTEAHHKTVIIACETKSSMDQQ